MSVLPGKIDFEFSISESFCALEIVKKPSIFLNHFVHLKKIIQYFLPFLQCLLKLNIGKLFVEHASKCVNINDK